MPDYDLQIFDRNGIRLYAGNKGWDGTYKGSRMSPDTYFYLLRYTDNNNSQQVKKGSIMLIRQ
jgi:gliding motility-associated-like protein